MGKTNPEKGMQEFTEISMTFMNSRNNETSIVLRVGLDLTADKTDLWRGDNHVALSKLSIYYTWENIKKSCRSIKFKISETVWMG